MNDFVKEEDIEALVARDRRWKAVRDAVKLDEELRDSFAVNVMLEALTRASTEAMDALIQADPTDIRKISSLQAIIKCVKFIGENIETVRKKGLLAQTSLESEDTFDPAQEPSDG